MRSITLHRIVESCQLEMFRTVYTETNHDTGYVEVRLDYVDIPLPEAPEALMGREGTTVLAAYQSDARAQLGVLAAARSLESTGLIRTVEVA